MSFLFLAALRRARRNAEIAMRYMSYVLYPVVVGYSIYSLRYEAHKGWYTWVLGSLVGAV